MMASSGPRGAQVACEGALGLAAREHEHLGVGIAETDQLHHEVRRGAEPRQAQSPAVAESREAKRAVPDGTRAQQRRSLGV
jgi:hypothetical protein